MNFIHLNLKTVYEDEDVELYKIMNIEKYFKNINDIDKNIVEIGDIQKTYDFVNQNIDRCLNSNTMKKIRDIFKENKNLNYFNKDFFNIAIHIRRCSIHKNIDLQTHYECENLNVDLKNIKDKSILPKLSVRFTDDSYYISLMNMIRNQHPNAKFHIYSEGVESDFSNFIGDDIIFHLNESLIDTYTALVFANILITSKSSFSYSAALLSENIVFYKNFWHPPASHWYTFN